MNLKSLFASLSLAAATWLPLPTLAGPGHDHGEAAPSATGPALPRFTATSDLFELVGVLNGQKVTLYLDRSADNAPVTGAQIELEMGDAKLKAEVHDDFYELTLPAAPQPGVLPVTATITAGAEVDLLAGELDIHEEAAHDEESAHVHGWQEYAAWGAAGVVGLIALAWIGRRLLTGRRTPTGAAA